MVAALEVNSFLLAMVQENNAISRTDNREIFIFFMFFKLGCQFCILGLLSCHMKKL